MQEAELRSKLEVLEAEKSEAFRMFRKVLAAEDEEKRRIAAFQAAVAKDTALKEAVAAAAAIGSDQLRKPPPPPPAGGGPTEPLNWGGGSIGVPRDHQSQPAQVQHSNGYGEMVQMKGQSAINGHVGYRRRSTSPPPPPAGGGYRHSTTYNSRVGGSNSGPVSIVLVIFIRTFASRTSWLLQRYLSGVGGVFGGRRTAERWHQRGWTTPEVSKILKYWSRLQPLFLLPKHFTINPRRSRSHPPFR